LTIGVETDVKNGEYIDVGFDFAGIDIGIFWSSWEASIEVDLEGCWQFDGDVTDTMGNHDGTNHGATYVDGGGILGGAYNFTSGESDYIDLNIDGFGTQTDVQTISFWLKTTDTDGQLFRSSGGSNYLGFRMRAGDIEYTRYTSSEFGTRETVTYQDNAWHHIVMIENSSGAWLYLDGSYLWNSLSAIAWSSQVKANNIFAGANSDYTLGATVFMMD